MLLNRRKIKEIIKKRTGRKMRDSKVELNGPDRDKERKMRIKSF